MMHVMEYVKPDGRKLWLYGRTPVARLGPIPSPSPTRIAVDSHLRRHPVLQEWVVYASHRQDRTFLPPSESDPLAPTSDRENPTELPSGDYDVAVFENRFPSLIPDADPAPLIEGTEAASARGACEVVVFARDATKSLGELPLDHIALIFEVWAQRTQALRQAGMAYVLPFENRGREMAVRCCIPTDRSMPMTLCRSCRRVPRSR